MIAVETFVDEVLGPVRWCSGCDEEWPADAEFWPDGADRCRACSLERRERKRERQRRASAAYRSRQRARMVAA